MDLLTQYQWPGNVRELQNIVERAVVLAIGPVLTVDAELLGIDRAQASMVQAPTLTHQSPLMSLHDAELQHIEAVLKETKGVIEGPQGAATILKLSPNTLRSRIKKLRLVREGPNAPEPRR